jgi:transposase
VRHSYITITCEVPVEAGETGTRELAIDLGLKDFAAFSNESLENVEAQRFYRDLKRHWLSPSAPTKSGRRKRSTQRLPSVGKIFYTSCPHASCVSTA